MIIEGKKKINSPVHGIKQRIHEAWQWVKTKYQDPSENNLFAKRLNIIFLALGLSLAIALLLGGVAAIPFTGGGSSLFIAVSMKLFFVLGVTTTVTSIGRNLGRLIDTILNPYLSARDKVLTLCNFLLASALVVVFWKLSLINMIASYISPIKNMGITLFGKILFSCSFTAFMISTSELIKTFINTLIYRFNEPNISKATRIGNLLGCLSGLVISLLLIKFHEHLGCLTPIIKHLSTPAKIAFTALNTYIFTGIFSRTGKHIGSIIALLNTKNRSFFEKAIAISWLTFCIAMPAICIFHFHLNELHNGLILVSKALKSWEIQSFFTIALAGTLISCGNKLEQAIDNLKKSVFRFANSLTKLAKLGFINSLLTNPYLFKKVQIFFTASITLFASLLGPLPAVANTISGNKDQIETYNNCIKTGNNEAPTVPKLPLAPSSPTPTRNEETKDNYQEENNSSEKIVSDPATILKKLTKNSNKLTIIAVPEIQLPNTAKKNNEVFVVGFIKNHELILSPASKLQNKKVVITAQAYESLADDKRQSDFNFK